MREIWHKRGENMPKRKRPVKVTDLITDGVCRLIERGEKPYSELTVQDIVDEAGVCRNSFYRNYGAKDDIFRSKLWELFAAEASENELPNRQPVTYYSIFGAVAALMRENRRFFLCFYQADARAYFDTITSRIIGSNTTKAIDAVSAEEYYTYACRAWIGIGVLTEWLRRSCDLPIDALVHVLQTISL